jgi:hypothetical protein
MHYGSFLAGVILGPVIFTLLIAAIACTTDYLWGEKMRGNK